MDKEYKPSEKEQKTIDRVNNMFSVAKKARESTEKIWRESEALYMGHHWEGMNMPEFKNQITLEFIASAIDTMIPVLSSRPPRIDVIAIGNDQKAQTYADTAQAVMDEFWMIRDMQNLVSEWLLDYLIYGNGILKVHWNPDDDLPDCDVVDPFNFYTNPSATKLENADWCLIATPTPIWKIREMYENGKYVKSESNLSKHEALKMNQKGGGDSYVQVTDTQSKETNYFKDKAHAMKDLEERALLIEIYSRGGYKEDDKDYVPGQVKMCAVANNILLYEGRSKYPFFNKKNHIGHPFPFINIKNGGSAHSFWGKPEPRRLKSINLAMDRVISQTMDNIHMTANPMWIVDQNTDVQDQITNKPGQIIRKRGSGQVSMQQPASMPNYVFNFYQQLENVFETISGVNKATQGKDSSNVTSGVQAQIYRQASTTKIDYKSRAVEKAIQCLGTMWMAMFKNLGTTVLNVPYYDAEGNQEVRSVMGIMFADFDMHIRCRAGSMMPENKQFVENKILQLAQLGIVTDPEYVVEHMNLPAKERLIALMRQQKEEAKQAENPLSQYGATEDEVFDNLKKNPEQMANLPPEVSG